MTHGGINAILTGYSDDNFSACLISRVSLSSSIAYLVYWPNQVGSQMTSSTCHLYCVAEIVATEKPICVIQWILYDTSIKQVITNQCERFIQVKNPADIGAKVQSVVTLYPLKFRALGGVHPHNFGTRKLT